MKDQAQAGPSRPRARIGAKPKPSPRSAAVATRAAGSDKIDLYSIKRQLEADTRTVGRRELNKVDKLHRISAAAREQFAAKGYEGTTLRDIAEKAGVALGTISFYAETKQDLVLLIFNAAMTELLQRASDSIVYERSLVDSLIRLIRPIYTAFGQDVALYRILLRENVTSEASQHAIEFRRHRGVLIAAIGTLIGQAEAAGEVRPYLDVELASRTAFFVLFAAVRWWIAGTDPEVQHGLRELRRMLALLVDGMKGDAGGQKRR